jgi:uncharacterized protein
MSNAQAGLSSHAQEFQWLVANLAAETPGVRHAIAVSADGLLIVASDPSDLAAAHRLAAVVSGMLSLAGSAARGYGLGGLHKVIVDLSDGYIVISSVSTSSVLGLVADKGANVGLVAYEMAMFAARAGHLLGPATILELQNAMS